MHGGDHGRLGDARNKALVDRRGGRDTQPMAIETSFAEEVTRPENSDDCFLAPLGNDAELDLAGLDVKDRVRRVAL
jgi:hypothetical protein